MKRNIFIVIALCFCMTLAAATISKEEARQKALQFLTQHKGTAGASRRAQSMQSVDGIFDNRLYLFNIGGQGGFVVVSGDDSTDAILGFADSGQIDLDNMPDNMRAWLQGYADEIAWLQEHPQSTATQATRRSSAIKKAISPLLTTEWNQNSPFNNFCPLYDGQNHSATGCQATAMAQIMRYHKHPASPTLDIASYKWNNTTLGPLTKNVVFDWDNMLDNYKGQYTAKQADAVALFMKYCGYSIQMDYGSSSSSNNLKTFIALKKYYDYNASTLHLLNRNDYNYIDWVDIIYHEVVNARPVLYTGQSLGGGHAFVVDGYQDADYFHINWGWGGTSDSYFKLSILDPKDQGIGGSTSNEAYNYRQIVFIGIQKSSESGSIHEKVNKAKHTEKHNLILNKITLSRSTVELGDTVNVTFNITNNGDTYYDRDIFACSPTSSYNFDILGGKMFYIKPHETKDCTITFKPKKLGINNISCYIYFARWYQLGDNMRQVLNVKESSASSDVELTLTSGDYQNVEQTGTSTSGHPMYNLIGNDFQGTILLTNSTNTPFEGYVEWKLFSSTPSVNSPYAVTKVSVPAQSKVNLPLVIGGLEYGESYGLYLCYKKGKNWTSWMRQAFIKPIEGIDFYDINGSKNTIKPTGTTFTTPANALAVDVTGLNISTIIPNSQPNALYIYSNNKPSGLEGKNVVYYDGKDYNAPSVLLTDEKPFCCPFDIKADNVTFTYNKPATAANGTDGWNTLMLPFDVTEIKADDKVIDWFHSSADKGKDFWLREFVSDDVNTVNFKDVSGSMKGNVPYIIALPGNKWGSAWDLSNKTIRFIGNSTTLLQSGTQSFVTGSYYRFYGNTIQDNTTDIYTINESGNKFVSTTGGIAPFRAYFKNGYNEINNGSLIIGSDETTGVSEKVTVNSEGFATAQWYTLDGRRLSGQPTQKGLYIVNGKKIVIK